jgi:hypothetical protein
MLFGTLIKIVLGFYSGCVGTLIFLTMPTKDIRANLVCKDKAEQYHKIDDKFFYNHEYTPITKEEYESFVPKYLR